MIRIERHSLGPRVHVLGHRVHEYQLGFALLAVARGRAAALAGLFLVAKDWPDLFPGTRDRASWRWGIHRLPGKTLSFLFAALAVATFSPDASAKRPRPTDVPTAQTAVAPNDLQLFNDYAKPARTFASACVVHYVGRVGGTADAAIEYFARRGFRRIAGKPFNRSAHAKPAQTAALADDAGSS